MARHKMRVFSFAYNTLQEPDGCVIFNVTKLPYPSGSGSGLEEAIQEQVLANHAARKLVLSGLDILRNSLDVAFGCMTGFQRSVALAEETARQARDLGLSVTVEHLGLDDMFKEGHGG